MQIEHCYMRDMYSKCEIEDFLKSQIATLNENGNKRGLHITSSSLHSQRCIL